MLDSAYDRELRNGKRYNTNPRHTMSESGSIGKNAAGNSSKIIEGEVPEIHTLTQEEVNEQIKGFNAPLTRQLEELTWLVQGMVTIPHPSHYPRAEYSTTYGIDAHQSDNDHCCK